MHDPGMILLQPGSTFGDWGAGAISGDGWSSCGAVVLVHVRDCRRNVFRDPAKKAGKHLKGWARHRLLEIGFCLGESLECHKP